MEELLSEDPAGPTIIGAGARVTPLVSSAWRLGRAMAASAPGEPAGGVLSTRAAALRRRAGGPGSSDSFGTARGAIVVAGRLVATVEESPFVIWARGLSVCVPLSELLVLEAELLVFRLRTGRSGSLSTGAEDTDEPPDELPDAP